MANRRMFSRTVVERDDFIDMPLSAQALYLHLCMEADDDGCVDGCRRVQRGVGASADDLRLLVAKGFVHDMDGVAVIADWRANNYVQKDRYTESRFHGALSGRFELVGGRYVERAVAGHDEPPACVDTVRIRNVSNLDTGCIQSVSGLGTLPGPDGARPGRDGADGPPTCMDTVCIQNVSNLDTQVRLGKVRSGKERKDSPRAGGRDDDVERVVSHLNAVTGRRYSPKSKAIARAVRARLAEGHAEGDLVAVIDHNAAQWLGDPRMAQYVRPSTLFAPGHFAEYLAEASAPARASPAAEERYARYRAASMGRGEA